MPFAYRGPITTPNGLGFTPFESKSTPNPRLADVVNWMKKFAHSGKVDPAIRGLATEIIKEITPGDYASEALALYYWVCANIRYVRDPSDVEYVQDPRRTVQSRAADCDDEATLLAALLMTIGNTCAFEIVSFSNPPSPTHVYVSVDTPKGPIPLDPVANRETVRMMKTQTARTTIPLGGELNHGAGVGGAPGGVSNGAYSIGSAQGGVTNGAYSIYDYANRCFNYFEAPYGAGEGRASGWFRDPRGLNSPECIAALLPANAVSTGSGRVPRGTMATMAAPVSPTLGEIAWVTPAGWPTLPTVAAAAAVAVIAYKVSK